MERDIVSTEIKAIDDVRSKAERVFDNLDIRESTRADYKSRIGLFTRYIQQNGLNHNTFLEFKRHLGTRVDFSVSTKNKYLTCARVFLKELNRLGLLPVDTTHNIKNFTHSKRHKRDGINEDEMLKLTESLHSAPSTASTTRLKAIFSLLSLQGLRQVEITRLDVQDIDFVGKTAMIQGKGKDDKEAVDLLPQTLQSLQEYLKLNRISDGALFTSKSNNRRHNRLTTRSIRGFIKKTLRELGIEKTTHGFRHYFTTKLIRTYKGDLLEVANYTRHKSLEMLQVYNDNVKRKADLPRFYETFSDVSF